MPSLAAISVHRLTKHYGSIVALNDLELEVHSREIFGFLGLNGAGKTTTIRILLDLLRPTRGEASVLGRNCQTHGLEVRAQVGYLPGEMGFYGDMTGRDTLDLLARLSGHGPEPETRRRLLECLQFSSADLSRKIREYSTGMKRKLGIIQAFQGDPPLLILDEPTEGLDPVMQASLYELLFETRQKGRTVFMSSHVLSEVEKVCDRIALLRAGELVLLAPVEDVRKLAARRVRISFSADVARAPDGFPPEFQVVQLHPREWSFRLAGPMGTLMQSLAGLPVLDVQVEEPHLEDVLIQYYRERKE